MKFLFLAALVLPSLSFAQIKDVHVKNFNLNYQDPSGKGHASHFDYSLPSKKALQEEQTVEVIKDGSDFHLTLTGTETKNITVDRAPAFLTEAQTINLDNLNLSVDQKLALSLSDGQFVSATGALELQNFGLNCNRSLKQAELADQALVGCIESMTLTASKWSSKDLGIKAVKLNISQGSLTLSAEVKAQISGTARGKGSISYNPATGIVAVKLSEVKFGIIGVTGQVFDALKKSESDKLKVERPWIYYKIK